MLIMMFLLNILDILFSVIDHANTRVFNTNVYNKSVKV